MKIKLITVLCLILLAGTANAKDEQGKRKVLYYRNPMSPSITSDVPAKDAMGMDYIPVYEEEKAGGGPLNEAVVVLSPRDVALAGVQSEPITYRHLFKEIRAFGRIAYDPELYKAQEEFIQALAAKESIKQSEIADVKEGMGALVDAARLKLRLNGLSDEQIDELPQKKEPDRSLIISDEKSPFSWVYADVYEYDLSWIKQGAQVRVFSISFPQEEFSGKIEAIDPVLNPMTRSARIRLKIENNKLQLKPQMYVDVFLEAYLGGESSRNEPVLAVPKDAVLDTGARKVVYIDLGEAKYLGKEVRVGPEATAYVGAEKQIFYPVEEGLSEGDKVVTKANFLIDSQSQISGAAAAAFGGALGGDEKPKAPAHSGH